jgi:hypothetical protein
MKSSKKRSSIKRSLKDSFSSSYGESSSFEPNSYENEVINKELNDILNFVKNQKKPLIEPNYFEPTTIYFVDGAGCNPKKNDKPHEFTNFIYSVIRGNYFIEHKEIHYRCYPMKAALLTILTTYFRLPPLKNNKYVKQLTEEILRDLRNKKRVFLMGHSFGGAICNTVAESIQLEWNEKNDFEINNLKIVTTGTIYIAKKKNVKNIDISNYISTSDYAILCSGLKKRISQENMTKVIEYDESWDGGKYKIYCSFPEKELQLVEEDGSPSTVIQICLFKDNKSLCRNKKPSILYTTEHSDYYNHPFLYIVLFNKDIYHLKNMNKDLKFEHMEYGEDYFPKYYVRDYKHVLEKKFHWKDIFKRKTKKSKSKSQKLSSARSQKLSSARSNRN